MAKKSREKSIEESNDADDLMKRIIFLEGHPNLQTLAPCGSAKRPRKRWNAISPTNGRRRRFTLRRGNIAGRRVTT